MEGDKKQFYWYDHRGTWYDVPRNDDGEIE